MNILTVIFPVVIFITLYISSLHSIYNQTFSEYKRSLAWQLDSKIYSRSQATRYVKLKVWYYLALVIGFIIAYIYPPTVCNFFLPLFILILFDYFFLSIGINHLKHFIFNINIENILVDREYIFGNRNIQTQNRPNFHEEYRFVLPDIFERENLHRDLLDMRNFIWILRLYKQGEMKYFSYVLAIVVVQTVFLVGMYKFYFIESLGIKQGFFIFIFSLLWLAYSIARLKSLLGLNYFLYLFSDYQKKIELRPYMRYLTIYRIERATGKPLVYNIKRILQDIVDIKNTLVKNLDYFIGFVSTIVYVSFLTFMLAYK